MGSAGVKPIAVISAGRTAPALRQTLGDFDDWIAQGLGAAPAVVRLDARKEVQLPDPASFAGVVVSGSHAMVTDREDWSERLGQWLAQCVEQQTPVLGICYGHQLLAQAMGGVVDYRASGREIGSHAIRLTAQAAQDPLFSQLPASFNAQLVHSQSVLQLPPNAHLLAEGTNDGHQAYRVGSCAWGVQFHPEFSAQVMRFYVEHYAEGEVREACLAQIAESHEAASLLARFAQLSLAREAASA